MRDGAPARIIAPNAAIDCSVTHSPLVWVGLGGVSADDNETARAWQDRLHWAMVAIALMSTFGVRTPRALAICRFCVTARTKSPSRVRVSRMYTSSSTNAAKPMMTMRLYGSTTLVMT